MVSIEAQIRMKRMVLHHLISVDPRNHTATELLKGIFSTLQALAIKLRHHRWNSDRFTHADGNRLAVAEEGFNWERCASYGSGRQHDEHTFEWNRD